MKKIGLVIILLTSFAFTALAQQLDTVKVKSRTDSLNRQQDSVTSKPFVPKPSKKVKVYHPDSTHSPGLAVRRSAMVPGWGQWYNRKWWKVPIIYVAVGAFGYNIVDNKREYNKFLAIAKFGRNRDPQDAITQKDNPNYILYQQYTAAGVTQQAFEDQASNYQRNFQLSILGLAGAWLIQMVDAYIDAKFIHSYTMDNNLSFKLSPAITQPSVYALNNMATFTPVLKLTVTFK